MNVLGFSKSEREICRYDIHLNNTLVNIFRTTDKFQITITGSTSEGICGGIHSNQSHDDYEMLLI